MRYKTDMEAIKGVALSLLYTTIHETEFSPIIVQHPFTSSGCVVIRENDQTVMLNILESEENLRRWQKFMSEQIKSANDVYQIFILVNKPYGLTFLKFASESLSDEDFSKVLCDAWISSENPNCDANVSKEELIRLFKSADTKYLMAPEERNQLNELDDIVTVYRGVTSYNADNIYALSWSLKYDKADWFAHRFNEDGTVYQGQISKKNILALFNGRNESEIILDPNHLMNVIKLEEPCQDFTQSESFNQNM